MTSSDRAGPDAEARARAARNRVRAGHVGIGAVADVEQRALRAFEQHAFAARRAARGCMPTPSTTCGASRSAAASVAVSCRVPANLFGQRVRSA